MAFCLHEQFLATSADPNEDGAQTVGVFFSFVCVWARVYQGSVGYMRA